MSAGGDCPEATFDFSSPEAFYRSCREVFRTGPKDRRAEAPLEDLRTVLSGGPVRVRLVTPWGNVIVDITDAAAERDEGPPMHHSV